MGRAPAHARTVRAPRAAAVSRSSRILLEAGFDDATATLAFSALYAYMLGQLEIDENAAASRARPRRRNAFSGVAPRAEPLHPDDIFEFGFDLMLDALRRKLPAR